MPASDDELTVMANEELDAACAMPFVEVRKITPWGDSYEGFAPSGRTVEVERRYLWAVEPEGGVIVEVEVRDRAARTGAEIVAPDAIYDVKADIYAPCALGATLNPQTLDRITARAVVGAANNQLATPEIGRILFERGVLYAPDYVVNGGGIINVAAEMNARQTKGAFDPAWVEAKLSRLIETFEEILDRSAVENRPTHEIADAIAEARIAAAGEQKRKAAA